MADFDSNSAECSVFTFKEGLLSAVAHDLRIKVTRFSLKADRTAVEGRWDAGSLVVDTPMRDGHPAPGVLSQRDLDKIARNIVDDVLLSKRYPEIRFVSSAVTVDGDRAAIKGELTLAGRTRPVAVEARKEGGRWVAEVWLNQLDFGVKPYSAMLGALKIKPEVRVRVSVPADRIDLNLGAS